MSTNPYESDRDMVRGVLIDFAGLIIGGVALGLLIGYAIS